MFGQLYVDTLLDHIHVATKKAKESQAVKHAEALIANVKEFKEHAKIAVKKILEHLFTPHIMPTKDNPSCAPLSDGVGMCVCTIAIGPNEFDVVDKNGIPTDKTKSFCIGVISSSGEPCKTTMRTYSKEYLQEPAIAVATYWRKQLGETVAKWANIAEILQSMVDKHKR